MLIFLEKLKRINYSKYGHWFLFVVIFSAAPILLNIFADYLKIKNGETVFNGVRLMDFLICGFCLIGGALCDRYNSKNTPSGVAVGVGVLLAVIAIGLYAVIRLTNGVETDSMGRYAKDDVLVNVIVSIYFMALFYSLVLMRKTG